MPRTAAVLTGDFSSSDAISSDKSPDAFAALEQQSWREFQFLVLSPAMISVRRLGEAGPKNPKVTLHISDDGDVFKPMEPGALAASDQIISIIVSQSRKDVADGVTVFHGASFEIEILAQRVLKEIEVATLADLPALSQLSGSGLGCAAIGCGNETQSVAAPTVTGDADPTAEYQAPAAASSPSNELARELQTELARVGCYDITIDGLWGPGSRKALAAFNVATGNTYATDRARANALAGVARADGTICQ